MKSILSTLVSYDVYWLTAQTPSRWIKVYVYLLNCKTKKFDNFVKIINYVIFNKKVISDLRFFPQQYLFFHARLAYPVVRLVSFVYLITLLEAHTVTS